METDDAVDAHEDGDGKCCAPADGPRWLANRINGIDYGMRQPGDYRDSDKHLGEHRIRIRQNVEQGDNQEGNNVLQVV